MDKNKDLNSQSLQFNDLVCHEILLNFISNAVKFTKSGFIKIKVKCSNQNDTLFDAQLENICANKILLNHFKRDMGPSRKKSQSVKSKFTYL